MGQYLRVGVPIKIVVQKKDIGNTQVDRACIQKGLQEDVALCHYNLEHCEDDAYTWNIKPSLLEDGFLQFYEDLFNTYEGASLNDEIETLKSTPKGIDRINLARQKRYVYFQSLWMLHYIDLHDHEGQKLYNGRHNTLDIAYEFLIFFSAGKILMECYRQILRFFEKSIRAQYTHIPIASCLKVLIL